MHHQRRSSAGRRQRAAGGDRRVYRIAGRGREHQVGHLLELAPVLVATAHVPAAGWPALRSPSKAKTLPARWGKDLRYPISRVAAREHGREAHLLGLLGGGGPCDQPATARGPASKSPPRPYTPGTPLSISRPRSKSSERNAPCSGVTRPELAPGLRRPWLSAAGWRSSDGFARLRPSGRRTWCRADGVPR